MRFVGVKMGSWLDDMMVDPCMECGVGKGVCLTLYPERLAGT
jgi:hypothetical protein